MIPAGMLMLVVTSTMVYLGQTGLLPMFTANIAMLVVIMIARFLLAKSFGRSTLNRKVPLYGSRYCPMEGERVNTAPTVAMAIEDRPVQGTVTTV